MTGQLAIEVAPSVPDQARAEQLVIQTLKSEGKNLDSVSIGYVGLGEMQKLNREHRGKDKPTDVLSFPFSDDFPQGSGGEVVICPEQADPQGQAQLDHLLIHGTLHLLGYEDETDAGLADMEARTRRILEVFNGKA